MLGRKGPRSANKLHNPVLSLARPFVPSAASLLDQRSRTLSSNVVLGIGVE